jgi:environmental stress-induced protein Ves
MSLISYRKANQVTTRWSGGETTQLCIFPLDAVYANRDFIFRISSAIIHQEESTFTQLKGYQRSLMILKGSLEIIHANRYSKYLQPYEIDTFEGDWSTTGKGKAVDFNVMTSAQAKHTLTVMELEKGARLFLGVKTIVDFIGIYIAEGALEYVHPHERNHYTEKDFLLLMKDSETIPEIIADRKSKIILVLLKLLN